MKKIGNSERIGQLLDYLGQTIKDGDGFVREQAPLLAREVVHLQLVSSIVTLVAVGTIATLAWRYLGKLVRSNNEEYHHAGILFRILVVLVGGLFVFVNGYHAMQAAFAPRMVVMNYIRSLK